MEFKFPVASYRKLPNPHGPVDSESKLKTPEMIMLLVNIQDLPDSFPLETNPREQNMKTKVAGKIKEGLKTDNKAFHILNRGILLSVKNIKFDNNKSLVTVEIDNTTYHGIVDGGHSYRTILENRENMLAGTEQFARIEVLVGIENIFEDVAAARNTSVQVHDAAIMELKKKFEAIVKDVIKNEPYADKIAYKENEDKPIDISDLLTLMFMFNINRFPDKESMPTSAYSSKQACLKSYMDEYEKNTSNDQRENPYFKMKNILTDLVKIADIVEYEMEKKYKETNPNGKFGSVKGVDPSNHLTKFYMKKTSHRVPKGLLYPIISSFRALVKEEDGMYVWAGDPLEYWNRVGKSLVNDTVERSRSLGNNPNAAGKDTGLWKQNYQTILTDYLMTTFM